MDDLSKSSAHWSFWAIAGVCLAWNLLGCMAYLSEFDAENLSTLSETRRTLLELRPAWATAAFAIAVWGGALGCLLLLLRKAVAFYALLASLLGVIVQMYYNLILAESTEVYGPGEVVMTVMIPLVALFLIWYSKYAQGRRWIS